MTIARALRTQPQSTSLEESNSALDPEPAGEVVEVMERLPGDGMTVIVATPKIHPAAKREDLARS